MRVLFLNANWRQHRRPLAVDTVAAPVATPIEYGYLSAAFQGRADTSFFDGYGADASPRQMRAAIREANPDAVVISSAPSMLYWRCPPFDLSMPAEAVSLVREVSDARTIIIGPHGTVSPEWTMKMTGADTVFRGSPEVDLPSVISGDDGLSRTSIPDVGQLPVLDLSIFGDLSRYEPHLWDVEWTSGFCEADLKPAILAETSRGCPYRCDYCFKAPLRDRFARRPLRGLCDEWRQFDEAGVQYVFFIDETFNLTDEKFWPLLHSLSRTGFRFGCQARPDLITDEIAIALADAGCVYVECGIDTADPEVSSIVNRRLQVKKAWAGIESLAQHIPVVRYNRLNLRTADYSRALGTTSAEVDWSVPPDPAFPYPNTRLGELIMRTYGKREFSWEFAEKYSWWLRLEVAIQRKAGLLSRVPWLLETLQASFLELPSTLVYLVCQWLNSVKDSPSFRKANQMGTMTRNG